MDPFLQDPIIWGVAGFAFVCFAGFIWSAAKLFKKTTRGAPLEDLLAGAARDPAQPFDISSAAPLEGEPAAGKKGGGPAQDVLGRLDTMTQRLSEMQGVLSKQMGTGGPAGGGQSLTPETVDKLLKIVGSVMQQVDVLQRGLGSAPAAGGPVAAAGTPVAAASTVPAKKPLPANPFKTPVRNPFAPPKPAAKPPTPTQAKPDPAPFAPQKPPSGAPPK